MRDLSLGDRGKEVSDVQTRLRRQGFELGREGVDGFFGPQHRNSRQGVPAAAWPARRRRGGRQHLARAGRGRLRARRPAALPARAQPFAATTCSPSRSSSTCWASTPAPSAASSTRTWSAPCSTSSATPACRRTASSATARSSSSNALRKAEAGREGKKIPDRDERLRERPLADRADRGRRPRARRRRHAAWSALSGLAEKDFTLALGLRLAELLRAEGCRVRAHPRRTTTSGRSYARAETADAAAARSTSSRCTCNGHDAPPAAAGAACYYFQRSHYYSEHGAAPRRLHRRRGSPALGATYLGSFGPQLRASCASRARIAVLVEPLFATNADEAARAAQPGPRRSAWRRHSLAGLADYLARAWSRSVTGT